MPHSATVLTCGSGQPQVSNGSRRGCLWRSGAVWRHRLSFLLGETATETAGFLLHLSPSTDRGEQAALLAHRPYRTHTHCGRTRFRCPSQRDRAATVQPRPQRRGVVRGPITRWAAQERGKLGAGWVSACSAHSVRLCQCREEGSV